VSTFDGNCIDSACVKVYVQQNLVEIFIPNVFTVNEDNVNDQWGIQVNYALSCEVSILNRWGNVIHVLNGLNETWDGKENGKRVKDGVYFYRYRIIDLYNNEKTGHGHFTLVSNGKE
jgi:gliding motility-associated-like protein